LLEAILLLRYPKEAHAVEERTKSVDQERENLVSRKEEEAVRKEEDAVRKERPVPDDTRQDAIDAIGAAARAFPARQGWFCPEKLYQQRVQQKPIRHRLGVTISTAQADV
jgi:hypothetical protein